jgi:autotransporter translocation and assembly factor TamB
LSSLGLVTGLLLISLTVWLQATRSGQHWLAGELARKASARLALTVTVGRVTGSLLHDIRCESIVLRDSQGRLVAQAEVLSARYRLLRLVRRHEVDELDVVRPIVGRPPSAPRGGAGERPTFAVHSLTITDASLQWSGHDVQHLSAHAALRSGPQAVRLSADVHGDGFDARGHGEWAGGRLTSSLDALDVGVLHAQGTMVGPPDALDLKLEGKSHDRALTIDAIVDARHRTAGVSARSGATTLTGAAHVDATGVEATLDALVAPAEAAMIGIVPVAPIRLRVAARGPPRELKVRAEGRLRASRVALAGRVDLLARSGRVRFVAKDVRASEIQRSAPELAFSGRFAFDGAVRGRTGIEGRMAVSDGSVRVGGRRFERLRGAARVQLGQPGEVNVTTLSGQLRGRRPRQIDLQTLIRWSPRALRFEANRVALDESRAAGEVLYTKDPVTRRPLVTIRAQRMSLAPALIDEALRRRPSKPWPGSASLDWTPDGSRVSFAFRTEQGPVEGVARLRRGRGSLEVPSIALDLGGSRLRGAARVKNGEVIASLDEFLLEPRLVHWLWPALEPARTVRIHGAVAGPLHALDLRLLATAGASTAKLRGQIDLRARSFRLMVVADTFYLQSIKETRTSRVNLELALQGRVVEGGIAGTLTVRRAWGTIEGLPLEAARLDAKLDGPRFDLEQILVGVPGAILEGRGGGTYRDFRVGYGVVVTDSLQLRKVPKSLRVMVGLTALTPGRSVVGTVRRHQGGKIEMTHHTIPPPFRVVNLLYHVLTGHPLHLTVH